MVRVVLKNEIANPIVDSNNVSLNDQSIDLMVQVLDTHLNIFCQNWNLQTPQVLRYSDAQPIKQNDWIFYFRISGDPNNTTISFHDLNDQGVVFGAIYVDTIINNNGFILSPVSEYSSFIRNSPVTTVSAATSHEVIEALADQNLSILWYSPVGITDYEGKMLFPENTLVSGEVADPVENNLILYSTNNQSVAMSDFILPGWTNPKSPGPFNFSNTLTRPYQIDQGGYANVAFPFIMYQESIFGDKLINQIKKNTKRQIRKKSTKSDVMQMLKDKREKMLNRFKSQ
ncbi:MAG: hypothetical protein QW478_00200 [Candidatus Micrarchaeaceae archaeon]